eukprot:GSA120T00025902001.1
MYRLAFFCAGCTTTVAGADEVAVARGNLRGTSVGSTLAAPSSENTTSTTLDGTNTAPSGAPASSVTDDADAEQEIQSFQEVNSRFIPEEVDIARTSRGPGQDLHFVIDPESRRVDQGRSSTRLPKDADLHEVDVEVEHKDDHADDPTGLFDSPDEIGSDEVVASSFVQEEVDEENQSVEVGQRERTSTEEAAPRASRSSSHSGGRGGGRRSSSRSSPKLAEKAGSRAKQRSSGGRSKSPSTSSSSSKRDRKAPPSSSSSKRDRKAPPSTKKASGLKKGEELYQDEDVWDTRGTQEADNKLGSKQSHHNYDAPGQEEQDDQDAEVEAAPAAEVFVNPPVKQPTSGLREKHLNAASLFLLQPTERGAFTN